VDESLATGLKGRITEMQDRLDRTCHNGPPIAPATQDRSPRKIDKGYPASISFRLSSRRYNSNTAAVALLRPSQPPSLPPN